MATKVPTRAGHIPHVTKIRGSVKEAAERAKADSARRAKAGENGRILAPSEVAGGYSTAKALMTTLGGSPRYITDADLKTFRRNVAAKSKSFRRGITAQEVINLSRPEDRERANSQIHYAIPTSSNRGIVRFITNAGPDSDATRHFVEVEFLGYGVAVGTPTDPKKLAGALVKNSPLKFQCDCGRHTFWYRFLATIGGFALGRQESGFPRIRNPKLSGVACKHVLRVMHEVLRSTTVKNLVARMIERGQNNESKQAETVKAEDAKRIAKTQNRSTREIKVRKAETKALRSERIATKKAPGYRTKTDRAKDKRIDIDQARADAESNLRKLRDSGVLSAEDFKNIIATLGKKKG